MGVTSITRGAGLWWPAVLLGLATIGAYGTVYYAIGVLIPEISSDTGWSAGALSGAFSLATLGQGAVALAAGNVLDRRGSRLVLLPCLFSGALLLLLASFAGRQWEFVVCWAAGGAAIGGGTFYNVTMPVTARIYASRRSAAFSVLTLLGALASPIFYPLAGWLIDISGWRTALRILVALTVALAAPAALLVQSRPSGVKESRVARDVRGEVREPKVHRALLVFALASFASSGLLLHQVSAMRAAGISIALASVFAGARGAFQIPGRLFLSPLVARLGVRTTMAFCYGLAATAVLALLMALVTSHPDVPVTYFAIVGGISLGLLSPLNGLFQVEAFGEERLGVLSGLTVVVTSAAAASGAFAIGLALDATGSYDIPLIAVMAVQAMAIGALIWQGRAASSRQVAAIINIEDVG
ncbi:MAG TPA: MFS transporter [Dehalococcoidia bacterium]